MKTCYEETKFHAKTLKIIDQANTIIKEYQDQGFDLTLRQLFYQFVSKELIPNNQTEYKRLGDIISKGRRAGLIDWDAIVDRTRYLRGWSSSESPQSILYSAAYGFHNDLWQNQECYIEVWFEKDALMGIFESATKDYRIPYFSCRGYASDSEIYNAAQRLVQKSDSGKDVIILHFGDHDPSGLDMTRDIESRLELFDSDNFQIRRLALNWEQIQKYKPPPNPAKETDSRFEDYKKKYGDESWELDALSPTILSNLVKKEVMDLIDLGQWDEDLEDEKEKQKELMKIADNYDDVVKFLKNKKYEKLY